jgi:hypothetical protein
MAHHVEKPGRSPPRAVLVRGISQEHELAGFDPVR